MSEPPTPRTSRWLPAACAVAGIAIGVAGTAITLSKKTGGEVAYKPPAPKKTTKSVPAERKKPNPSPAIPVADKTTRPMDPFDSTFILPKLPAPPPLEGRLDDMSLKGAIRPIPFISTAPPAPELRSPLALPKDSPLTRQAPTSIATSRGPLTGKTSPASDLDAILAKGLPKAPAALHPLDQSAFGSKPAAQSCSLVTVRRVATSRDNQADEIADWAKQAGGTSTVLSEQGKDRKPLVSGLLIAVPTEAAADLMKKLSDGEAFIDKDSWSGTANARQARLTQDVDSKIASLKSMRTALLATYLEDAEPVKDIDAQIATAQSSLDQLSANPAKESLTVIRVIFVGK